VARDTARSTWDVTAVATGGSRIGRAWRSSAAATSAAVSSRQRA
jgi:hypothetical protein